MVENESSSSMGGNVSVRKTLGRVGSATTLSMDWVEESCRLRGLRAGSSE